MDDRADPLPFLPPFSWILSDLLSPALRASSRSGSATDLRILSFLTYLFMPLATWSRMRGRKRRNRPQREFLSEGDRHRRGEEPGEPTWCRGAFLGGDLGVGKPSSSSLDEVEDSAAGAAALATFTPAGTLVLDTIAGEPSLQ